MKRINLATIVLILLPVIIFAQNPLQDPLYHVYNPSPETYMHYGDGIKADILVVDYPGSHQDKVVESMLSVDSTLIIGRFNFPNQIYGLHYADSLGIKAVYLPNGGGLMFASTMLVNMHERGYLSGSDIMFFTPMESNNYYYISNPSEIPRYSITVSSCDETGSAVCSYGPAMEFTEYYPKENVNSYTGAVLAAKVTYVKKKMEKVLGREVLWQEVRELCRTTASNFGDWKPESGYGTIDTSAYRTIYKPDPTFVTIETPTGWKTVYQAGAQVSTTIASTSLGNSLSLSIGGYSIQSKAVQMPDILVKLIKEFDMQTPASFSIDVFPSEDCQIFPGQIGDMDTEWISDIGLTAKAGQWQTLTFNLVNLYQTVDNKKVRPFAHFKDLILVVKSSGCHLLIDNISINGIVDKIDETQTTNVAADSELMPTSLELFQNYPNPFNPTTTIKFSLPVSQKVILKVYNITGQEVVELVEGIMPLGSHQVVFDGTELPTSIYIYQLVTESQIVTKKMSYIK